MGAHGLHVHPTPDVTIDYFAAGSGSPVVLVHGRGESRRVWDPLLAPLIAAGHRVTAVDLRGHGDSSPVGPYDVATMAADLGAVLEQEGITDAVLIGHGSGALVAVAGAAAGRCRGVVCLGQVLDVSHPEALAVPSTDGLPGHERWRVEQHRTVGPEIATGPVVAPGVPLLAIHGTPAVEGYDEWLAAHLPGAVCEWWPGTGGYPHLADPQRFVERLAGFSAAGPDGRSPS